MKVGSKLYYVLLQLSDHGFEPKDKRWVNLCPSQGVREDVNLVQQQICFLKSLYEKRPDTKAKNLVLGNNQSVHWIGKQVHL